MKRNLWVTFVLALGLFLAACGGNSTSSDTSGSNGSNSSGGQSLLTEDRITGDGSMAREQYYADTVREEFTFDKKGVLTGYKTVYTFENGVNDQQKQEGLDTLLSGNFSATIVGNTIEVDGNGYYLGFDYSESNLTEIKERLDEKGYIYNLGDMGKVSVPARSSGGGDAIDINTVEGRLSKAGLALEDIKPETFAEASLYNCDKDEIVMYITNGSDKLGSAAMKPLVEKVLAATAGAADDGKNYSPYYGLGDPQDLDMNTANYDAWSFIGQWSYKTDGKWVTVTLGVVPAEEPEGQDQYSWEVTLAFLY